MIADEHLAVLKTGENTNKVLHAIFRHKLEMIMFVYRSFTELDRIEEQPQIPTKELIKVIDMSRLKKLRQRGWIRDGSLVFKALFKELEASRNFKSFEESVLRAGTLGQRTAGRPSRAPLNILLYLLEDHLAKARVSRNKWKYIAGFLAEQGIANLSQSAIREQVSRLKHDSSLIEQDYEAYSMLYYVLSRREIEGPKKGGEPTLRAIFGARPPLPLWRDLLPR